MAMQVKHIYVTGDIEKVRELATAGTITPGSFCVTSEGDAGLVISDKSVVAISGDGTVIEKPLIFDSKEEAESYLQGEGADTVQPGQIIIIKGEDGVYDQYIVQDDGEGAPTVPENPAAEGEGESSYAPVWEEM